MPRGKSPQGKKPIEGKFLYDLSPGKNERTKKVTAFLSEAEAFAVTEILNRYGLQTTGDLIRALAWGLIVVEPCASYDAQRAMLAVARCSMDVTKISLRMPGETAPF
jgi:hypothetical protein